MMGNERAAKLEEDRWGDFSRDRTPATDPDEEPLHPASGNVTEGQVIQRMRSQSPPPVTGPASAKRPIDDRFNSRYDSS